MLLACMQFYYNCYDYYLNVATRLILLLFSFNFWFNFISI